MSDLAARGHALSSAFTDAGVTFSLSGEERPFPLDVVPRLFTTEEWDLIERGVSQRVRALEAFLADVYGEGRAFRDGVLPRRLITTSQHFHRAAYGIESANGVRVHVAGIDLVRDAAGDLRVLEDNLRTPSGVSYVLENRRTMARVLPDLFGGERVRRVSGYPARLLAALRARPRRPGSTTRWSCCSLRAPTTPRTSSTRCSPARWASSWSRAATWSAATASSSCGRPRASSGSMSSTGASTTTSSIRCTSVRTR